MNENKSPEREILEKTIKEAKEVIERAEDDIKKLGEAKLRHGEVRLWSADDEDYCGGNCHIVVDLSHKSPSMVWLSNKYCCPSIKNLWTEEEILEHSTHVTYLIDDLAVKCETLESFEVKCDYSGCRYKVEIYSGYLQTKDLCFKNTPEGMDKAQEYINNLQKVVNHAKQSHG